MRCRACSLVYLDGCLSWPARAPHYDLAKYRGYHHLDQERKPLGRRLMAYGLRRRQAILEMYVREGRLLDAGCGSGDFLAWMGQRSGWQAWGLERNPEAARLATQRSGRPVLTADLAAAGLSGASFEAITLWSVLEHLADPVRALAECARLLRRGGFLFVRTLSQEAWGARFFGPNWVGFDAPRVLLVLSRTLLRMMLHEAGLEVVRVWSPFHDYHPFLWSWQNWCAAQTAGRGLCRLALRLAGTWPVRAASFPYFALQSRLGGDSFVTVVARKP